MTGPIVAAPRCDAAADTVRCVEPTDLTVGLAPRVGVGCGVAIRGGSAWVLIAVGVGLVALALTCRVRTVRRGGGWR